MTSGAVSTDAAMTAAEVAAMLGVTRQTVDKHTRSGRLPSFKVGDARRYDRHAVEAAWGTIDTSEWLDVRQTARRLNVSADKVRGHAAAGKLPATKTPYGWRIHRDELEQWIANGGAA